MGDASTVILTIERPAEFYVRSFVSRFLALSIAAAATVPSLAEAGARRRVRLPGNAPIATTAVKSDESIHEAIRRTPTNGVCRLPRGAFRTTITVDRSMTIVASPLGTTIDATSLGRPAVEILAGVADVTIDGVRVVGATDGIVAQGGNDRLSLRRVTVVASSGVGVRVALSGDVSLDRVVFDGNALGGLDLVARRARLTGLSFRSNGAPSATLGGEDVELLESAFDSSPEGVRFAGLRCRVFRATMRNVDVVARFARGSDTSTLARCDVRGTSTLAITDEGSIFATIEGNRTDVTTSDAIRLAGSWHMVENNTIAGSKGAGVVGRGTSIRVTENTLNAPAGAGVRLEGDGNTVEANHVNAAGSTGVSVTGDGCVIAMNDCPDALGAGIDVSGDHNLVIGNRADSARGEGVRLEGDANTVQGNQLFGTRAAGIRIAGGSSNLVTSNSIIRCGGRGFEDAGTGTTLQANRID